MVDAVAAGLALTFKMEKIDNVVVAYFGEGASNTGDFHEALNFAGVQRLPIVFICENNQYGEHTPYSAVTGVKSIADRAAGLRPFLVIGSAGTVDTGAIDDLETYLRLAPDAREAGFARQTLERLRKEVTP